MLEGFEIFISVKAWRTLLVYTSVTPCLCTNLGFSERHSFHAKAQEKNFQAQIQAHFRHIQGTVKACFTESLGTVQAQFRHNLGTFQAQLRHILGTVWHVWGTFCHVKSTDQNRSAPYFTDFDGELRSVSVFFSPGFSASVHVFLKSRTLHRWVTLYFVEEVQLIFSKPSTFSFNSS